MTQFDLEVVDIDGAIREAEEAVAGDTRAAFFREAGVGGTAITAAGFMGMLPEVTAARPSKKQDIAILKYALTLEYLEAAFYQEAAEQGGLSGDALESAKLLHQHEATHVTALRRTTRSLGSKVPSSREFDLEGTNKGDQSLPASFVLENVGVRAHLGQAGRIRRRALLAARRRS